MKNSDIEATIQIVRTTELVVHCGGMAPFVCRRLPVSEAKLAMKGYQAYLRGDSPAPLMLDVTSVDGERTVIPFKNVIMMRKASR